MLVREPAESAPPAAPRRWDRKAIFRATAWALRLAATAWLAVALFVKIVPHERGAMGSPASQLVPPAEILSYLIEIPSIGWMSWFHNVMLLLPHVWAANRFVLLISRGRRWDLEGRSLERSWALLLAGWSHAFAAALLWTMWDNQVSEEEFRSWSATFVGPVVAADLLCAIGAFWCWRARKRVVSPATSITAPSCAAVTSLYALAWFAILEIRRFLGWDPLVGVITDSPGSPLALHATLIACLVLIVLELVDRGRPGGVLASGPLPPHRSVSPS